MTVATVKTYQPEGDIKSYAVKMFGNHGKGIGVKGQTTACCSARSRRSRGWIESGYGLEGFVTDGFAGESSRAMVPFFVPVNTAAACRGRDARRTRGAEGAT